MFLLLFFFKINVNSTGKACVSAWSQDWKVYSSFVLPPAFGYLVKAMHVRIAGHIAVRGTSCGEGVAGGGVGTEGGGGTKEGDEPLTPLAERV